jgi:hypothetical protein
MFSRKFVVFASLTLPSSYVALRRRGRMQARDNKDNKYNQTPYPWGRSAFMNINFLDLWVSPNCWR